jgi:hypothetical protein
LIKHTKPLLVTPAFHFLPFTPKMSSSSMALGHIAHSFILNKLEDILIMTDSHVFGLNIITAIVSPKELPYNIQNKVPLKIIVENVSKATFLLGYLMANRYVPQNFLLEDYFTHEMPLDGPLVFVHSAVSTFINIFTRKQVEDLHLPLHSELITLPAEKVIGKKFFQHNINWLVKKEADLTSDDYDLIQFYRETGFVILTHEPQEISDSRPATTVAAPPCSASGSVLHVRPPLNALSPHEGAGSTLGSLLEAATTGIPLNPPINRQRAAPSNSDNSTPETRQRTRTDSDLSDYQDCSPPVSVPRIFFPRTSLPSLVLQ